ncbi:hypothetical protein Ping_0788 [Psychromonas ingrahamii 37]|uniref:Glycosyltransferase n=1 Tax=Psychromonas ingrahamii (strain DSM 17664 / CCUG 51855 / 37) TaxID=357804 RepID=A1ST17_PSYIN|nr:glycosyltransferase [Psychromonas ingrahamii]ABM02632.1 hypothetical protein Ping_0788 [Psychromonas ingrahamii 37]
MNKILVNGTAAREGGALTIINQFSMSKKDDAENFYYILSPLKPDVCPTNYKWIKKETRGLNTLFFSLFFSWFYCVFFRCNKLISFSNVNTIFPVKNKVTYFHNLLIIKGGGVKYFIIKFIITWCNQKEPLYIFQTSYVQEQFKKEFHFEPKNKILWPGVLRNIITPRLIKKNNSIYNLVVPITNINHSHRNFKKIIQFAKVLEKYNINFLVTVETLPQGLPANIKATGHLSRGDFLLLIYNNDGILVSSEFETLCLPIFESLQLNRPAFVLEKEYVKGLKSTFGEIEGLFLYEDSDELYNHILSTRNKENIFFRDKYSIGRWEF